MGNLKDKAKIDEKIEEARTSHEKNWLDKSALRPETANILAIGIFANERGLELLNDKNCDSEKGLLETFWSRFHQWHKETGRPWAGYCSNFFDWPMIILRSRILGVPVPGGLRKGRYFDSSRMIDLQDEWLLGRQRTEVKSSLDYVARALGIEGKNGASGKDFGALYASNPSAAMQYLARDIWITKSVAEKLGYDMKPACQTFAEFQAKFLDAAPPSQAPEKTPAEDLF